LMGDVPFRNVLIHGIVRDFEGKKMSKSIGNVIDPLDLIERYGADALRFSLAFAAVPGNDTNISEDRIEGSRNFANKLWNAARFVLLSVGEERVGVPADLEIEDRWILSRLDETIEEVDSQLEAYNLSEAMRRLHFFIWSEYCDWYIELAKLRLPTGSSGAAKGVLVHVLDSVLRLLHPVMPFVTEELWSKLRPDSGSIMVAEWTQASDRRDAASQATMSRFQELVQTVRRLKVDHEIPQSRRVAVTGGAGDRANEVEMMRDRLKALARLESVEVVEHSPPDSGGTARTITPAGFDVSIDLGGVVDLDAERERLRRKVAQAEVDLRRSETKLGNESFVTKAPADVVERERSRRDDARAAMRKLEAQLEALGE
jgi:valyl-tRNA synthetase